MSVAPLTSLQSAPSSVIIERVAPELDGGRYPIKREVGDWLEVSADIFKDGHDKLGAVIRYRQWDEDEWREADMSFVDNDRWAGGFPLESNTRYRYTVQAFPDHYATWVNEITKKINANLDVSVEVQEGLLIIREAASRAHQTDRDQLDAAIAEAERADDGNSAAAALITDEMANLMLRHRSRDQAATYPRELAVTVDRVTARYAAWYELLPRSAGTVPGQSGTFKDVIAQLPRVQAMGFNVLYLLPIYPIGQTNKKGKNNSLDASPDDPGSPYAIGGAAGGHDAIDPELGTLEDFQALVRAAADHGLEIALDFAIQASPDHPWLTEHPEWFDVRPDGSIRYAENPPKRYEDIHHLNFNSSDWRGLWDELKRVVLFWVEQGVKIFRVDNPHTKPTLFWEWLIGEVQRDHPDVIFLAEAFTRPKVMRALAKAGFTQSYTYFTWRNTKAELTEYLTELTQSEMKEYFRGNFFVNTPDILPYILQEGGRPAFKHRLVLAATLSSIYGMYSGYELCENESVPGKEEYWNSEKYEHKVWDWDRPRHITDFVTTINQIRHDHPALHEYENLRFFESENAQILCYGKATSDRSDIIVVAVNLDPFNVQDSWFNLPTHELGFTEDEPFEATELITGESYRWTGSRQYVRLDPCEEPAQIFSLRKQA